jgi:hypothetical protein
MNLNGLNDLIKQAEEIISTEISKLPKEEQQKLNDLKSWSKGKSVEELQSKISKLEKDAK